MRTRSLMVSEEDPSGSARRRRQCEPSVVEASEGLLLSTMGGRQQRLQAEMRCAGCVQAKPGADQYCSHFGSSQQQHLLKKGDQGMSPASGHVSSALRIIHVH